MTQDAVRDYLWEHADTYVSGEGLASALGISRTAVWKAIGQLKEQGYEIESVTRKGYRLLSRSDVLSEGGIRRHLKHPELSLRVYSTIGSTNTELKALAARNAEAGLALVASQQTAGRGRLGRSFYSPPDTGIYLSLLLRPRLRAQEATAITAAAAVAVAETLEELSGEPMEIKWVNDVVHHGRKVAGILTEAAMDFESGFLSYVVVGIGINLSTPEGDFPEELRTIAGAAFGPEKLPQLRCRVAAGVLDRLWEYAAFLPETPFFEGYRARSLVLGKELNILSPGKEPVPCIGREIERDFALRVELPDGSTRLLNSGEVSVRVREQE